MGGARGAHGEKRNVYRFLLGKPEGKRLQGMDWIYLAQARDK
jgi:hypothetical protein